MRSRRSLLCLDTENDDRVDAELSRKRGVRSIIAVPLLHGGEAVGLLLLYGDKAGAFSERDVTMMELLSVVLSGAMAHAAEFEAKRDQVEALARFEATFAGGAHRNAPDGPGGAHHRLQSRHPVDAGSQR